MMGTKLTPLRCAHDTIGSISVKLNMYQWECVASKHSRIVVVNATVEGSRINACNRHAGVVPAPIYAYSHVKPPSAINDENDDSQQSEVTLKIGELSCGGFSGWSHAGEALHQFGMKTEHVWALDKDPIASRVYSQTHESTEPLVGIDDVIRELQYNKPL